MDDTVTLTDEFGICLGQQPVSDDEAYSWEEKSEPRPLKPANVPITSDQNAAAKVIRNCFKACLEIKKQREALLERTSTRRTRKRYREERLSALHSPFLVLNKDSEQAKFTFHKTEPFCSLIWQKSTTGFSNNTARRRIFQLLQNDYTGLS